MLARLRDDLIHEFMANQAFATEDCAALNVVFLRLAQTPYFQGGHDRFTLIQRSDAFFEVHEHRHRGWHSLDPLSPHYDRGGWDDDEEEIAPASPPLLPPTKDNRRPVVPQGEAVPPAILERADALLTQFRAHHPEWAFLDHPTPEHLNARHALTVERFAGAEALHERLRALLGPNHDTSLNLDGIRYHQPTWGYQDKERQHRYILAHNGQEVAGLVHYLHRPHDNGLSFIAVPPGFRHRGVSRQLYQALMDQCAADERLLKRSDPGDFAKENPGITRGYDRQLAEGNVLHVTGHGFLYNALIAALAKHPYARVLEAGKAVCDQACERRRTLGSWGYDEREADHLDTQAFQANLAALTPKPPEPTRRRRCR